MFARVLRAAARGVERPAAVLAGGAALTAGISFAAPKQGGEAAYVYRPVKISEKVEAAAAEAAKPRVAVPATPTPRVLFVLGGPGAGKGTQCALLEKEFGFVHLSAGDLLRAERERPGSEFGELIESYIREGKIVPVEITVALLKKAMSASGASKFLVDGFPRNFENLQGWERVMGVDAVVDGVLQFDVPEDTMVERLLHRGTTSGRSDDNIDSIRKRLRTYADSTLPVVEHYRAQNKVTTIRGDRPVAEVFAETRKAVQPTVEQEVLSFTSLLLEAISAGDWDAYTALVDPGVTCFEPEAADKGLVVGLPFHEGVFKKAAAARADAVRAGGAPLWSVSRMESPAVRLLDPRHALVTYTRIVTPLAPAPGEEKRAAETRLWELGPDNKWRLTHFHRSPVPAPRK